MSPPRRFVAGLLLVALSGCASGSPQPGEGYDLSAISLYEVEKPPRCPFEEVGMLSMETPRYRGQSGAGWVEERQRIREERERQVWATMEKTGADALLRSRAGHLLFIRFTDENCLE